MRVGKGASVRLEKTPLIAADDELDRLPDFADLAEEQSRAWQSIWRRFELEVSADPRVRLIISLHLFHLLQLASRNLHDLDVEFPPADCVVRRFEGTSSGTSCSSSPCSTSGPRSRSISAPLPAPATSRGAYCRPKAGYEGAMFPWQSGSDGREETQEVHLNPKSGRWNPDRSHRQRHINIAIAHNIVQYLRFTGDVDFLAEFGAEMLLEIARFWASMAEYDRLTDRFQIVGVIGPDDFHDDDPGWDGAGVRNNAYTNVRETGLAERKDQVAEPR